MEPLFRILKMTLKCYFSEYPYAGSEVLQKRGPQDERAKRKKRAKEGPSFRSDVFFLIESLIQGTIGSKLPVNTWIF